MTSWMYLALAILFEITGTTFLKMSHGFEHLWPSLGIILAYVISLVFLTLAVKVIPISIAYAIWAGVGTALIVVIGALMFREPLTLVKVGFIALIIIGVIGLHATDRPGAS